MTTPTGPRLTTERLLLQIAGPEEAEAMCDFQLRNREHLASWSPRRPPGFFEPHFWAKKLAEQQLEFANDQSLCLTLRLTESPARIIGECNFRNIVRGVFQACHLGYNIDAGCEGQGLMREALGEAIDYMFQERNLHRVQANYLPENLRSGGLLRRLGFRVEGYAYDYLRIDGRWRDHILTSKIAPPPGPLPSPPT